MPSRKVTRRAPPLTMTSRSASPLAVDPKQTVFSLRRVARRALAIEGEDSGIEVVGCAQAVVIGVGRVAVERGEDEVVANSACRREEPKRADRKVYRLVAHGRPAESKPIRVVCIVNDRSVDRALSCHAKASRIGVGCSQARHTPGISQHRVQRFADVNGRCILLPRLSGTLHNRHRLGAAVGFIEPKGYELGDDNKAAVAGCRDGCGCPVDPGIEVALDTLAERTPSIVRAAQIARNPSSPFATSVVRFLRGTNRTLGRTDPSVSKVSLKPSTNVGALYSVTRPRRRNPSATSPTWCPPGRTRSPASVTDRTEAFDPPRLAVLSVSVVCHDPSNFS